VTRPPAIALVLAAVAVLGCYDPAGDCNDTLTCTPPPTPIVEGPSDACPGTCVPSDVSLYWSMVPWLVWMGEGPPPPELCPAGAPNPAYTATPPPAAPSCGGCVCDPSSGSCGFAATASTLTSTCPGPGTALDLPSPWDGTCTTQAATAPGVQSVTVTLVSTEACAAHLMQNDNHPQPSSFVQACGGMSVGTCSNPGDACMPALPPPPKSSPHASRWTYCLSPMAEAPASCPHEYPVRYVSANGYTDTRGCAPCTCGAPVGSSCSPSLVSFYSDAACSESNVVGAVTVGSEAPMGCVDIPLASPLGSAGAALSTYSPGNCTPGGGGMTGVLTPLEPMVLCCLE
jgi:hypothetical protein